jgi:hypothetical protein
MTVAHSLEIPTQKCLNCVQLTCDDNWLFYYAVSTADKITSYHHMSTVHYSGTYFVFVFQVNV